MEVSPTPTEGCMKRLDCLVQSICNNETSSSIIVTTTQGPADHVIHYKPDISKSTQQSPTKESPTPHANREPIKNIRRKRRISTSKVSTSKEVKVVGTAEKKRKKAPRPKDMPRHPLTAYNFFFSDERERILQALADGKKIEDMNQESVEQSLTHEEKQQKLLEHLERRREKKSKRRPHRKTHGKISFQDLAIQIGKRWRELGTKEISYYHELAEMDMSNYRKAMDEYKSKKENEAGLKSDATCKSSSR